MFPNFLCVVIQLAFFLKKKKPTILARGNRGWEVGGGRQRWENGDRKRLFGRRCTHSVVCRWGSTELYTWNLCGFVNRVTPINSIKTTSKLCFWDISMSVHLSSFYIPSTWIDTMQLNHAHFSTERQFLFWYNYKQRCSDTWALSLLCRYTGKLSSTWDTYMATASSHAPWQPTEVFLKMC